MQNMNMNTKLYDGCDYETGRLFLTEGEVIPLVPLSFFFQNVENMGLEVSNILIQSQLNSFIHLKGSVDILGHTSSAGVHWSFSNGLCRTLA